MSDADLDTRFREHEGDQDLDDYPVDEDLRARFWLGYVSIVLLCVAAIVVVVRL